MTEINFSILPFGFCPACLDRMKAGDMIRGAELPDVGIKILHAYCEHREVGAILTIRPGVAPRWRLQTPIDVLDWEKSVALQIETQAQLRATESAADATKH
jgi:hypothetical protein